MWETNGSVSNSLSEMVNYGLDDDYFKTYDSKVRKLSLGELQKITGEIIKPELVNWFVVGDKSKIYDGLKELGYEIIELDPDGNPKK